MMDLQLKIGLMVFDPAYGTKRPYPSEANQYREWHGNIAWIYNPYTGNMRDPRDIGTDPFGKLIAIGYERPEKGGE